MSSQQENVSQKLRDAVEENIISQADALEIMLQAIEDPDTAEKIIGDRVEKFQLNLTPKKNGNDSDKEASPNAQTDRVVADRTEIEGRKPSNPSVPRDEEPLDDRTIAGGFRGDALSSPSKASCFGKHESAKEAWPTRSVSSKSASTYNKSNASAANESSPTQPTIPSTIAASSIKSGFGRYEIREEIGRGGCGIVSLAFDHQLQRVVVVKQIINKSVGNETAQRFLNEAQITGQLEHPGIVPVYEMGEDPSGLPFYAMKFLDGQTLADVIADHRALAKGEVQRRNLRRMLQRYLDVCNTLAFSHENGIIHRDLKPANIMVGQFGETVVLDWGLARRIEFRPSKQYSSQGEQTQTSGSPRRQHDSQRSKPPTESSSQISPTPMTMQGTILGTAAYMAPEQAKGNISQLDRRSDVFSLGVILYEILSGKSPFRGDTLNDTIRNVTTGRYKKLRSVSKKVARPLAAICEKAMHIDQDSRYENAGMLANDIEAYLSGQSTTAYRENWFEQVDRIVDRYKTVFRSIFIATVLIAMVAIVATGKITKSYQSEKSARELAVAAKDETEAALVAESDAKQHALERLAIARSSIDNWLIQLSGDLQFYPGLEPIRNQLIESGKSLYQKLYESSDTVLRLKEQRADLNRENDWFAKETLELAKNAIRLGDLARLQNSLSAAEEHYSNAAQKLLTILPKTETRLERGNPVERFDSNDLSRHESKYLQLANAQIGLALCNDQQSQNETAISHKRKSTNPSLLQSTETMLSELVNLSPKNSELRNALARTKLVQGRCFASQGLLEKSIAAFQAGLIECNILIQSNDEPRHIELKTNFLRHLAQTHVSNGQQDTAISDLKNLIAYLDQRIDDNQPRPDWLEERSWAETMLGQNYAQLGQTKLSLKQFKFAQDHLESAKRLLYGDEYFLANQSIIFSNLGQLQKANGQPDLAEQCLRASVAQLRLVIETNGATTDRIKQMAQCYQTLGELMLYENKKEAKTWFAQNDILLRHLASQPDSKALALKLKTETALIHAEHFESQALLEQCNHQRSLALKSYKQLADLLGTKTEPNSMDCNSVCQKDVAFLHARISRLEILCDAKNHANDLKEKLALFRQVVSSLPTNAASHSFGLFVARTFCEVSAKDKSFLPTALNRAEQLSKRFPESHQAWFACAVTRLVNGQFRGAVDAMQQVKLCRVEESPIETMLDCLLSYHDDRIPKSQWKEVWLRAASKCQSNPWQKILGDAYAAIPD